MAEENSKEPEKLVEKYYIEINPSARVKFINGLLGGIGWGIGITLGTAIFLGLLGFIISKIDFVPIFGHFLSDVIKSSQSNLK